MAKVKFAATKYAVNEGIGRLNVVILRSGNIDVNVIVLVATDNFQGSASGLLLLASYK